MIAATIQIDRNIDDVFRLTMNHVVDWCSIVVEDEPLVVVDDGGVGTTFRVVTLDRGRRMEFMGSVVAHDPPRSSSIVMAGEAFEIATTYEFESIRPGRTRVHQTSSVTSKGITRIMFFLLGPLMRRVTARSHQHELERLKSFCETGSATPSQVPNPD